MAWISNTQPVVGPRGERIANPGQTFTDADLEAAIPGYVETAWWRAARRKLHGIADEGAAPAPAPPAPELFVEDDDDLTSATLLGAADNSDISRSTGAGDRFRIRIQVEETDGGTDNWNFAHDVYWLMREHKPEDIIRVSFEDLLLRTNIELFRICDLLGVLFQTQMLNGTMNTGHRAYNQSSINVERV